MLCEVRVERVTLSFLPFSSAEPCYFTQTEREVDGNKTHMAPQLCGAVDDETEYSLGWAIWWFMSAVNPKRRFMTLVVLRL